MILSPIEQSIKRKIEAVGRPLREWDVQINYGIKTGYNEAFVIDSRERELLLSRCVDAAERERTEAIIRPILRGRDIKRYGYDWANLYLIATFPACNYDINKYPAIKQYLLSFAEKSLREAGYDWVADSHLSDFCKQKLSQTGKLVEIEGKRITIGTTPEKARKRTNNQWFETQDSISYWEDFSKPKIIWKRVGSILRFSYDDKQNMTLDSTCFATGNYLKYLCCVLNSNMGSYLLKDAPKTGTGDLLISVQAVEPIQIPMPQDIEIYNHLFEAQLTERTVTLDSQLNSKIYDLYDLTEEERSYIDNYVKQFR